MQLIGYCILLGISLGCFRYLQIRFNKKLSSYFLKGTYGDASTYFFLTQFFRNNSCGVSDPRCLISDKPVLVPSLYMKIVGKLFNDDTLFKRSWLPNILLYTFFVILFLYFTFTIQTNYQHSIVLIVLLFLFQPDNISLDKHRIQYSVLQPRFFGLLVNSSFWVIYIFHGASTIQFFDILTILTVISINTSIFCRQTSLFSIIISSVLSLDPYLFLILPAAFLVSAILFPKEFIPSIPPQVKYSYQYFLNYYKPKQTGNFILRFIKNLIARPLLESYPYFVFMLLLLLGDYIYFNHRSDFTGGHDILVRFLCVYHSVFVIFCLTGIRKTAFLGECWRYISYCTYFSTPVLVIQCLHSLHLSESYIYLITAIIVVIYILLAFTAARDLFENKNSYLVNLLKTAPDEFKNAVWYGVPYRVSTLAVALGYGKKTFEYQYGNHSKEIHDVYFSQYPFLKWDNNLLDSNRVTHILVEEELAEKASAISGFSVNGLKKIASNDQYSIYRYAHKKL